MRRVAIFTIIVLLSVFYSFTYGAGGDLGGVSGANGTKASPWLIEDFDDFQAFCADSSKWDPGVYTRLETDLDLAPSLPGRQTYSHAPIAYSEEYYYFDGVAYSGSFDGNGHTISNLTIDGGSYLGLFGYVDNEGSIFALNIENIAITGIAEYVSGFCGFNYGTISGCYSTGTVKGDYYVGGLCGMNYDTISDCYSTAAVSGEYSVGGLCGENDGPISGCYSTGSVSGNEYVGGLCGDNYETISDCYSTGIVMGNQSVGGLSGDNYGTIIGCYSISDVTGIYYVGGLCASNNGLIIGCYSTGSVSGNEYVGGLSGDNYDTISSCYSIGAVTGNESVGGFCAESIGEISDSFWDVLTSGIAQSGDDDYGAIGKTTQQMQTGSTYTDAGWDFSDQDGDPAHWFMPVGDYPKLFWQPKTAYLGQTDIKLEADRSVTIEIDVYCNISQLINWELTGEDTCSWITGISPNRGSSTGPDAKTTVTITIDSSSLSVGDYNHELILSADNGDVISIPVILHVYKPVGMHEFALLAKYWLMDNCTGDAACSEADLFIDGTIDILDLQQLAISWLGDEVQYASDNIELNFESGDFSIGNWQLSGDAEWAVVSTIAYQGNYAAKSGLINDYQQSVIEITIETGTLDTISFYRKVSSEADYDYLNFYIDGVKQDSWSGNQDWTLQQYTFTPGEHTFKWIYEKDESLSEGYDCAWIDNIKVFIAK